MLSLARFSLSPSWRTSQRGLAPRAASHWFVAGQSFICQAPSGLQTRAPPPRARNPSTALRWASLMVVTTTTLYLPVASRSAIFAGGHASTSSPSATIGRTT